MVKVRKDLTGQKFGRLTVIKQDEDYITKNGIHYAQWLCRCNCKEQKEVVVMSCHLKSGKIQSCGCLKKEIVAEMFKKENRYDLSGEFGIGYCSNTNKEFYFDLEDYDVIKKYCWRECTSNSGNYHFVGTSINENGKRSSIAIHQIITTQKFIDHIDRNPFNNRKENFRQATYAENNRNRTIQRNNKSGIIGVGFIDSIQKWYAAITVNHQVINLGYYINKDDAIKARLEAEIKYHGEFASQKHLYNQYGVKEN